MKNHKQIRWSNNIAANVVRSFQASIKTLSSVKPQKYLEIKNFINQHQIHRQLWGFYAIFIFLIYLRDSNNQLKQAEFNGIIFNFQGKLRSSLHKYKEEGAKEEYEKYINQLNRLKQINFQILAFDYEDVLNKLIRQLIRKKLVMIDIYYEKLKAIIFELKETYVSKYKIQENKVFENEQKNDKQFLDSFKEENKYEPGLMMEDIKQMRMMNREIYTEVQ